MGFVADHSNFIVAEEENGGGGPIVKADEEGSVAETVIVCPILSRQLQILQNRHSILTPWQNSLVIKVNRS